jgi:hypothetical protein
VPFALETSRSHPQKGVVVHCSELPFQSLYLVASLNCGTVSYHVITTCPTGELLTQSLPNVTEGSQVVGRPPLVSETWFTAEVFQGAQNESIPFLWMDDGSKASLVFRKD